MTTLTTSRNKITAVVPEDADFLSTVSTHLVSVWGVSSVFSTRLARSSIISMAVNYLYSLFLEQWQHSELPDIGKVWGNRVSMLSLFTLQSPSPLAFLWLNPCRCQRQGNLDYIIHICQPSGGQPGREGWGVDLEGQTEETHHPEPGSQAWTPVVRHRRKVRARNMTPAFYF